MTATDLQLPDDVDALKAMILAMAAKAARADVLEDEVADLKARNADADEQIAKLKQVLKAFLKCRNQPWIGCVTQEASAPAKTSARQTRMLCLSRLKRSLVAKIITLPLVLPPPRCAFEK